jgi:hypothetical protein
MQCMEPRVIQIKVKPNARVSGASGRMMLVRIEGA